CQRYITSPFTF
nr:immunoglobulin light chain junction region [Macaca mulatta]MOV76064.1 immunoglobulin light chain junction region [Macaca mulatta]